MKRQLLAVTCVAVVAASALTWFVMSRDGGNAWTVTGPFQIIHWEPIGESGFDAGWHTCRKPTKDSNVCIPIGGPYQTYADAEASLYRLFDK